MRTIIITLPDELEKELEKFKLDWSAVATRAIFEKAEELKKLKEFSSKVKVSDKVAKKFTDNISKAVAKRFRGK